MQVDLQTVGGFVIVIAAGIVHKVYSCIDNAIGLLYVRWQAEFYERTQYYGAVCELLHTDIDYVGVASYFTCILTGEYICIGNV